MTTLPVKAGRVGGLRSSPTLVPEHPVAAALTRSAMASAFANGLFYTVSALFLVRVAGFTVAQVGVGLTVAGAVGMVSSLTAGYLCDRYGPVPVLLAATAVQGGALLLFPASRGLPLLVALAALVLGGRAAQGSARAALIVASFHGAERVLVRARLGVVLNVFIGLGTVVAGGALLLGTSTGYVAALLLAGVLVLLSSWPLLRLRALVPRAAAHPQPGLDGLRTPSGDGMTRGAALATRPASPFQDGRYLAVSTLNVVLAMHAGVLTVGIPLWVTTSTSVPDITVMLLLVANTLLVVVAQTRVARRVHDARAAGRSVLAAGTLLLAATALFAASAGPGPGGAVVLLLLAVVLFTFGEIAAEVGSWGLAFDLAPAAAAGAYQGLNQTSVAAGAMLAPVVVTHTALSHGTTGWWALGLLFLTAGVLTPLAVREATKATHSPPIPVRPPIAPGNRLAAPLRHES